jgi:hypothetical protein
MTDSNELNTVDLTDDELQATIVACRAMLEGMAGEGSPRPQMLVTAFNKFVSTHNLKADLDGI